ncbi:hypothetical protein ACLKA6_008152 [Drosophila palustris]
MAFLKNRSFLTQFIQMRTCTFSMLWRRNSSFRQVMPKFPYPSAMNINRHQVVKPRPPPMSADALAQMYPNKYMTPKLTKHKSRKCISFLPDNDKSVAEAKERANKATMLQTEQLKKLMFDSDSDEPETSAKPKSLCSPWKLPLPPKQQQQQQQQQQQLQQQQHQSKQTEAKLQQQEQKLHGEQQESSRKHHQLTTKHQRQKQQTEEAAMTITLLRPRPPRQQHEHEHEHQHQQHEYHQQHQRQQHQRHLKRTQQKKTEEKVEKQVSQGEIKKFKVQHENMQKIKERDRKLKDHVEKLKVFDRINRLMKQQQEQEEKELTAYKAVMRTKERDRYRQLHSPRSHTQVITEQLRPRNSMHRVHTSRFQQPLHFAPYTPTNAHSDNGDVATTFKQHGKSIPKLSPATEFHKDKAAAMETHLREQVNSRDSALCNLCRYINRQHKSKF